MYVDNVCKYCLRCCDQNDMIQLSCNHIFHLDCLKEWILQCNSFNTAPTCTFCQKKIQVSSIENTYHDIKLNKNIPSLHNNLEIINGMLKQCDEIECVIIIIKDNGINVFSFALKPNEYQPSGTCNFSRIDNVTFQNWFSIN